MTRAAVARSGRNQKTSGNWLRRIAVSALLVISALSLSLFVAVRWFENQVLTTDNWVALISPLPKEPVVNEALAIYVSDKIFENDKIEQRIEAALPENAGFIATPVANQLKELTTQATQRVISSDAFQTIWSGVHRITLNRVLSVARGETPPLQARINERFDIDLSDSLVNIRQALGRAAEAIPALQNQTTDKNVVTISADLRAKQSRLRDFINGTDLLAAILPLIFIASLLWALALSNNRSRTIVSASVAIIILMLVELIGLRWLRQSVLSDVQNPQNTEAVSFVYDTIVSGLKSSIFWTIGLSALALIGGLLASSYSWAKHFRKTVQIDQIKSKITFNWWISTRIWIKHWQYYLWLAVAMIVLIIVAGFSNLGTEAVINAVLLILALFAIIRLLAVSHTKDYLK